MHNLIAQTKLWRLCHQVGLAPYIKNIYWKMKIQAVSNPLKRSINETEAKFLINDRSDYIRVESLAQEKKIMSRFLDLINSDDVLFDVGANIGIYSCFAVKNIHNGHVFAFEPEPTNADRLRANLERNAINWSVLEKALANTDREAELSLSDSPGEHAIKSNGDINIQQNRAQTLIQNGEVDSPDVIKIDVEGAELSVLEGFGDILIDVRTVLCEVHPEKSPRFNSLPEDVENYLLKFGFNLEILNSERAEYHILATKE